MSNQSLPSLNTIPVEIIYYILDYLDNSTILHSLRYVSKRLFSVTNTYNRYKLDLKSVSLYDFYRTCQKLNPDNVNSLILSDDDHTPVQTEIFLSLFSIDRFLQLQSINLLLLEELHLTSILQYIQMTCKLKSLTIVFNDKITYSNSVFNCLSSIISQSTLRKLDLTMPNKFIYMISWPEKCSINYLRLMNIIDIDYYFHILCCLTNMKKFVLKGCSMFSIDRFSRTMLNMNNQSCLISLSLEESNLDMDRIELLLSLTPSLQYLKLINSGENLFDGLRWEQFFKMKLATLKNFQCFLNNITDEIHHTYQLDLLSKSFDSTFWKTKMDCFFSVVFLKKLSIISLYSIPVPCRSLRYCAKSNKISSSTCPEDVLNTIRMTDVEELRLDLNELLIDQKANIVTNELLFPRVKKLILDICDKINAGSLDILFRLVNLQYPIEFELNIYQMEVDDDSESDTFNRIRPILEEAINLRSLIIKSKHKNIRKLLSIIPHHIRHLQICIENVEHAQLILEILSHLSSIVFMIPQNLTKCMRDIEEWLSIQRKNSKYKVDFNSINIWLFNHEQK